MVVRHFARLFSRLLPYVIIAALILFVYLYGVTLNYDQSSRNLLLLHEHAWRFGTVVAHHVYTF